MQQSISIRQVTKQFGDVQILKGINLEVAAGEFVILVGPSGCGKSTLLNCLAGLEEVSTGDICIGDQRVNDVSPKDRDIAMVFQSYALYPSMNVRENIVFGLQMRKVPQAQQDATVQRVAKLLQIDHLLLRKPGELSGGQRQRVAMGRALARDPGLFLFDEPLSNLDAKLRVEMRSEIKLLHQRTGTTTVYVTHDQVEAMTLGDRIAVMKDGLVQQYGTPKEIYERPANLFVAGFVGSPSMNFIPIQVQAGANNSRGNPSAELTSLAGSLTIELPAHPDTPPADVPTATRTQLTLGLRPEALEIVSKEGLPVLVTMTEPTGPDTHVFFELNGTRCVGRCAPDDAPQPGATAFVRVATDKALLFDPATGQRLG